MQNPKQQLINFDSKELAIECLRPLNSDFLSEQDYNSLGNKSLFERPIKETSGSTAFELKKGYYLGEKGNNDPTKIQELIDIAREKNSFTQENVSERNQLIYDSFINYLRQYNMIK